MEALLYFVLALTVIIGLVVLFILPIWQDIKSGGVDGGIDGSELAGSTDFGCHAMISKQPLPFPEPESDNCDVESKRA